jgi:hypothetical protein
MINKDATTKKKRFINMKAHIIKGINKYINKTIKNDQHYKKMKQVVFKKMWDLVEDKDRNLNLNKLIEKPEFITTLSKKEVAKEMDDMLNNNNKNTIVNEKHITPSQERRLAKRKEQRDKDEQFRLKIKREQEQAQLQLRKEKDKKQKIGKKIAPIIEQHTEDECPKEHQRFTEFGMLKHIEETAAKAKLEIQQIGNAHKQAILNYQKQLNTCVKELKPKKKKKAGKTNKPDTQNMTNDDLLAWING